MWHQYPDLRWKVRWRYYRATSISIYSWVPGSSTSPNWSISLCLRWDPHILCWSNWNPKKRWSQAKDNFIYSFYRFILFSHGWLTWRKCCCQRQVGHLENNWRLSPPKMWIPHCILDCSDFRLKFRWLPLRTSIGRSFQPQPISETKIEWLDWLMLLIYLFD